jgi:diguanylate cyclase (GGDEF)-like protein
MPSWADVLYLMLYPLFVGGAIATQRGRWDLSAVLDSLIVAGGCGLFVWIEVIAPQLAAGPVDAGVLVAIAYPILDVVLFGAVVGMLLVQARTASHILVAASLVLMLVADTVFTGLAVSGAYDSGDPLDIVWMASYLLWVPAALHPSMRRLGVPSLSEKGPVSWMRLAVLTLAALAIPAAFALPHADTSDAVLVSASAVLILLVMARLTFQIRRQESAARTDPLTGLPNRAALLGVAQAALDGVNPHRGLALLFLDLDEFKVVNDSLGHAVGDDLLVAAANRLREAVRRSDTVARLGGDEFVVLCPDVAADEAGELADRVVSAFQRPFPLGRWGDVPASISIGLVHTTEAAAAPLDLLQNADGAMYRAKARGRAQVQPFTAEIRTAAEQRLDLRRALRQALSCDELEVRYQPQVDLVTGSLAGVEALPDWERPGKAPLTPARFMAIAEESGLIVPIGSWVIRRAAEQLAQWDAELGWPAPRIAVKVSPGQFGPGGLADTLRRTADSVGVDPGRFVVEITESSLWTEEEPLRRALNRLKRLGVTVSIDEFGSGHSSLAHLRRLPVDELKIDRSLLHGLGDSRRDREIVTAVLHMGRALGLRTVADGVDTDEQMGALLELGCCIGQGELFGAPAPATRMLTFLRAPLPRPRRAETETRDTSGRRCHGSASPPMLGS